MYFFPAVAIVWEVILITFIALDRYGGVSVHRFGVFLLMAGALWGLYFVLVRPIR